MRKKIVAGNWKMNKTYEEARELMMQINTFIQTHDVNCEVVIAPPFLYLSRARSIFSSKKVKIAAQDMSVQLQGAYTGEISAKMLQSLDTEYVILGHSERRQYHFENDNDLAIKIKIALDHNIIPIYCCGELLEDREENKHFEINQKQIETALFELSKEEISKIVIAYEPVWAIGTGKTASPEQAQEMHSFIRGLIKEKYDEITANSISILYGGSVNQANAKDIFNKPDVDGGLIGGASLKESDFSTIIKAYNNL